MRQNCSKFHVTTLQQYIGQHMAAGAFYQHTALQHSAGATLETVYLSQRVWARQWAILAVSETAGRAGS